MAQKSKPTGEAKKPGRTIKEKRAAKHEKQQANADVHKAWNLKP